MIKKSLLGLGIIIIGFINFSYAGNTQPINHDSYPSDINSAYEITFLKGGGFLTNYLGQGKSILALRNNVLVWRTENGFPYFYLQSNNVPNFGVQQGFPDRYFLCDEITEGQIVTPGNCIESEIRNYSGDNTSFKKDLQNFFKKVNLNDLVYYEFTDFNWELFIHICRNSSELGKSLCFKVGKDNHYISGNVVYHKSEFPINSQNLIDMTFDRIPNSWISYAPGQAGYDGSSNIDGGSQNVNNSSITGNVTYSTCTKQKALNYYRVQGYKDKICYSSYSNDNDIYTGPSSVSNYSLTGTDIIDVRFDTRHLRRYGNTGSDLSYPDWFQYWRKSFEVYNTSYNTSGNVSNPFLGVPVSLFTLFGNIYSYGLAFNNESILEYCDLVLLDQDLNTPYSGLLGTIPCDYSAIDILADTYGVHAESGHVVQGSSWDGILNRPGYHLDLGRNSGSVASGNSSGLSYFGDGKSFINNSFNLLSDSFRFPDRDSNGIIPHYILIFMFALILFRFISH